MAWSIVSVLMASWALMVPLSASMDEPAHIVKAASVVRGQFVGEPGTAGHIVQVPRYIALSQEITCTAFQEDRSAQCQDLDGANDSTIVDSTTTAGQYNPIYYAIVGLPSLVFNDISGIYAMRIVSAILTSFFIAAAVAMAWSWRPRAYAAIGVALGLTPSMLFLGGALNPNAVETSATLAVFVAMLSIVLQRKTHIPLLAERCVVIVLAAAIGGNTRGLSPLWMAIALLLPLCMAPWREVWPLFKRKAVVITIVLVGLAMAFALYWIAVSGSLNGGAEGINSDLQFPAKGEPFHVGFRIMITGFFEMNQSLLGSFGWLEVEAPSVVFFVWGGVISAFILLSLTVLKRRPLFVTGLLMVGFLIIPAFVQGAYITGGGIIWQGRYALPLFAMVMFSMVAFSGKAIAQLPLGIHRRALTIVLVAIFATQIAAFLQVLARFTAGMDVSWHTALLHPEWVPPLGVWGVLALYSAASLVATVVLLRAVANDEDLGSRLETDKQPAKQPVRA
ncbi:DUF2142 domain-containing protein [Lysinibacter cavernae]|uniref:DUF2142 domain-containing protein n=1 Tax=Lysinibacter cavernae TaxID=1640652 RepID=A0A7X5R496_9MICO|nr:DUF2142 domain-containing protein [Lysinibacter cavernae]NIH55097.1 hypothetical protein [Lysinibacter cavernae]